MLDNIKDTNGLTESQYLNQYDMTKYDRPSVTVDALIFTIADERVNNYRKLAKKKMKILLIKRNEHPFIGQWALPGGFVHMDESLETAVSRELEEETGVKDIYLEQLYTYGDAHRDPRGRVISTTYLSLVDRDKLDIQAGSDAEDARWFNIEYTLVVKDQELFTDSKTYKIRLTNKDIILESNIRVTKQMQNRRITYKRDVLESKGIAFDHGMIIQQGIERLRSKLEYTDIVFQLMPELFTLSELQKTYEEILDKPLLKANFRRKVAKMVTETNNVSSEGGHRPSKLYCFNFNWEE